MYIRLEEYNNVSFYLTYLLTYQSSSVSDSQSRAGARDILTLACLHLNMQAHLRTHTRTQPHKCCSFSRYTVLSVGYITVVNTYTNTDLHTHIHAHTYTYTHTYTYLHTRTYATTHTHTHTLHGHTYTPTPTHTHNHTYTCTHKRTHLHTHTHTHRPTLTSATPPKAQGALLDPIESDLENIHTYIQTHIHIYILARKANDKYQG